MADRSKRNMISNLLKVICRAMGVLLGAAIIMLVIGVVVWVCSETDDSAYLAHKNSVKYKIIPLSNYEMATIKKHVGYLEDAVIVVDERENVVNEIDGIVDRLLVVKNRLSVGNEVSKAKLKRLKEFANKWPVDSSRLAEKLFEPVNDKRGNVDES